MKIRIATLFLSITITLTVALTIVACGVGAPGFAGIGGSGFISSGSISGFGSVFVNGVEFETDSATFDVEGVPDGTQDDLAIGMIVRVNGTINSDGVTGTAISISYDDELQGPVTALTAPDVDGITRSFTVLGTNVIVDSGSTAFDISTDPSANIPANTPFGFTTIADSNNVEISGFFDASGNLIATRVELKNIVFDTASSTIEIKGTISALSGTTFNLANLIIDAASAVREDLPNGLVDGQRVEVNGSFDAGIVIASKVEGEEISIDDNDEFELEGIITNYVDDSNFKISGVSVDANNAMLEPTTLILGNDLRVEVEGAIVNGILIASEVELRSGIAKVHAIVSAINTTNNTFEVEPVATQGAITITVSSSTKLEDDVNEIEPFTLNNLESGDYVEVRGLVGSSNGINATEVQVKEPGDILLQGVIQSGASAGTVKVFGIEFIIGAETEFEGLNDVSINEADFFSMVTLDTSVIKIEDEDIVNGIADEIEIEAP